MKYELRGWGDATKKGYSDFSIVAVSEPQHRHLRDENSLVVFPVKYDPVREETARDLATKLVAYLNDLDDKINDVKTLMSIAKE